MLKLCGHCFSLRFPVSDYPVIALMGAPGAFPVEEKNRWLQKFVRWSPAVENMAKEFVNSVLKKEPFVGIHLRNGIDFVSFPWLWLFLEVVCMCKSQEAKWSVREVCKRKSRVQFRPRPLAEFVTRRSRARL